MISTSTIPESAMEMPKPAGGRAFFICSAIAVASAALVIAEQQGFRIFDESVHGSSAASAAIPSPLEFLALVGAISGGVVSGLVCALLSVGWLIHRLRQSPGAGLGGDSLSDEDDCAAHNLNRRQ